MNALRLARAIAGLFFDDGSLAVAVLVVLACSAAALHAQWIDGASAMAFLVAGVLAALLENVIRTVRLSTPRVD